MSGIRGLIFDCDGVLFESRKANLAYYNTVLEHFDEPPIQECDHAKSHLCHTAASAHVFDKLLGGNRAAEAITLAAQLDYRRFIPYMSPEPGIQQAIEKLSALYPLAIATNRGYSMPAILSHFSMEGFFQTIVTSRDVQNPKPAPDMLLLASKRLQLEPDQLLFIGDSELDQLAAKAAGMPFAIYRGDLDAVIRLSSHSELVSLLTAPKNLEGDMTLVL